jgi:hypothetical protein
LFKLHIRYVVFDLIQCAVVFHRQHDAERIVDMIHANTVTSSSTSGNSVMDRWKKKYLDRDAKSIDYNPMELLLRYDMMHECGLLMI